MFVEGEYVCIVRRFGTEGLETIEQNSLSFRFPLSWLASQRMRATGQSIYLLEDQIIRGSPAVECLKMASTETNRISDLVAQLLGMYASGSKAIVAA
jgi:hypothetical protein